MGVYRDLSIIIPVYKSEDILEKTVRTTVLELEQGCLDYEIILVNDGSPDSSWNVARKLANDISDVIAVNLVKNYGQHTAVLCGLEQATGKYLLTMDDDLQNPPSEIIKLYKKIEEGYDLVFAEFEKKMHAVHRGFGTKIIDVLNQKLFDKPKDLILTNFRIFTHDVARRVIEYKTFQPYIPGLLLMHSSRVGNVLTQHRKREVGDSNYTLKKILSLVARLMFNYSSYPLKVLSLVGALISCSSFIWGVWMVARQIIVGSSVEGWTTLVVLMAFFNGFIILMLGVLGEYIVRLIQTISSEKSYHIREVVK